MAGDHARQFTYSSLQETLLTVGAVVNTGSPEIQIIAACEKYRNVLKLSSS